MFTLKATPGGVSLHSLVLLSLAGLGWQGAPSLAQGLGAEAADDQQARAAVEEVLVTGSYTTSSMDYSTGLDLSLRETPQSITVITRQQLDDKAITDIAQALRHTTGITVNQAETDRVFPTARGFSIDNIQFDGAPVRGASGGVEGDFLSDMAVYERVEIIRGSAGLLMGAGNPSAAINLIRKKPTRELASTVSVKGGRWDLLRTEADISSALGLDGRLRGRFVGAYQENESHMDFLEQDRTVLYGIMEADLTAATELSFGVDYQNYHTDGVSYGDPVPMFYSDGGRTDLPRSSTTATDWTYRDRERSISFATLKHNFGNGWRLNLAGSYMDGEYDDERVYVLGYLDRATGDGLLAYPSATAGDWTQYSFDARLNGSFSLFGREHQLVLGWNSSLEENARSRRPALDGIEAGSFYDWDLPYPGFAAEPDYFWGWETRQNGLYLSGRFSITEPLALVVGARSSSWEYESWTNDTTTIDESDSGIVSPYIGAVYDINSQVSAYASITEIYNFQTQRDREDRLLDPLEGTNYELGFKGEFFDRRLNASVAVFEVQQDNLATPDIQVIVEGVPEQRYLAVEGVTTRGYEAELSGELLPGLQMYAGYTHRVARDAQDNRVTRQEPEDMVRISAAYDLSALLPELTVGGGWRWQSKIYPFSGNALGPNGEVAVQGSYSVVDLFARMGLTRDLTVAVNVDNLLDEKYYESVGQYVFGNYGTPRNVSASLRWDF